LRGIENTNQERPNQMTKTEIKKAIAYTEKYYLPLHKSEAEKSKRCHTSETLGFTLGLLHAFNRVLDGTSLNAVLGEAEQLQRRLVNSPKKRLKYPLT
jgi:hypothetical protein